MTTSTARRFVFALVLAALTASANSAFAQSVVTGTDPVPPPGSSQPNVVTGTDPVPPPYKPSGSVMQTVLQILHLG